MKRRTLPVVAAFAALLLTACGGGDDSSGDSQDSGKIAGADEGGGKKKESPSPTAPRGGTADHPAVRLPSDVKNVYESWKTGDPVKDAALADARRRIDATDAAIADGESESETIPFYYKGEALVGAARWISGFKKDGLSITGTTRYYAPQVTEHGKTAVSLLYCADESKAYTKNRKTGKPDKTPVTDKSYVLYNTRLDKNEQGVWQTTMLSSQRGNAKCTP
ncbi:hypothetical protein [Streptomyces spectabilis]|uniref:Lipoprotein n=1 Tax=Streptomyces spectabilis TaxID=68270 RepID=A0A5P2XEW6_STRST|nr:hypothetical protein [Streptomyces spectabilis]MBB5108169.1 hypothetical protein [Streptomyces spectabilis]MCI3904391.1 hypothetical protein [Streptomyces spectabilis]QEV61490.1 hypothetical protein CP982_24610 [Streptomyces spectabilis]GGV26921.1 lipoprotein [Streptomyces spectabilis]